jgi:type VI protein secretion system component Hcp
MVVIETASMDKEIVALLDRHDFSAAKKKKKEIVHKLEAIKDIDAISAALYKNALKGLKTIKQKNYRKAQQESNYAGYVMEEECDMGYALF